VAAVADLGGGAGYVNGLAGTGTNSVDGPFVQAQNGTNTTGGDGGTASSTSGEVEFSIGGDGGNLGNSGQSTAGSAGGIHNHIFRSWRYSRHYISLTGITSAIINKNT
jgi:hypothetical protein